LRSGGNGTSICVLLLSGGFVSDFLRVGAGVGAAGTTEGWCGLCAPLFEGRGMALFFEEGSGIGAREGRAPIGPTGCVGVAGVGLGAKLGEVRGGMLAPGFGAMLGEGDGLIDGGGGSDGFEGGSDARF
jgi:hypothetical protein